MLTRKRDTSNQKLIFFSSRRWHIITAINFLCNGSEIKTLIQTFYGEFGDKRHFLNKNYDLTIHACRAKWF